MPKIPGLSKGQQGKNWIFVINNYDDKDCNWCLSVLCSYIIVSKEIGEQGTPHLQGYIQFDKNYRLAALKKLHPKAHWEIANGNSEQNYNYVAKANSEILSERGQRRSATLRALKNREDWKAAITAAKAGKIDDIEDGLMVRYYNTWKKIAEDNQPKLESLTEIKNLWIYGPTGSGKSHMAREQFPDHYIKNLNKWWCGYQNEKAVIIEEYHPDCKLNSFVKIWADKYPFRGEFKGGSKMIRPETIIVCSNYSIEECFHGVDLEAVKRRFKVIHKI